MARELREEPVEGKGQCIDSSPSPSFPPWDSSENLYSFSEMWSHSLSN